MGMKKGGSAHGIYVHPKKQDDFQYALRKLQRRRPGKTRSELAVDCIIEVAATYQDIPGLDDLPADEEVKARPAAAV